MKIYISLPENAERKEWIAIHAPGTKVQYEEQVAVPVGPNNLRMTRTRFYYDLPDKVATLYNLRWA